MNPFCGPVRHDTAAERRLSVWLVLTPTQPLQEASAGVLHEVEI